jgi:ribulose-phosphate 3-epimerase
MKKIAPSILSADFGRVAEEIKAVEEAGADWIHLDIMDGHFVPNLTIGPPVVKALRKVTALPFDVHLMIENPDRYLDAFIDAGSDVLTIHVEATAHLHRTINHLRERNIKAGVALNPSTPLWTLEEIITDCDLILIMTVNPGFGGQHFIPSTISKIRRTREMIARQAKPILMEADGGISPDNIQVVSDAGVDVFVAGAAIFGSDDYFYTVKQMKKAIS